MKKIVQGIVTPLVTPLIDNDTLDITGLERLIEHVISGGVHGIFILGTTGEAQSLAVDEWHQCIRRAASHMGEQAKHQHGDHGPGYAGRCAAHAARDAGPGAGAS